MKKILYTIALLLTWVSVALATDVTITQVDLATNSVSAKIPNFNVNNLGNNAITISNVTIVNGTYATLSCSACFRPTWVGLGGFTIKVGTDLYTVRNVDSTSQVTLTKGCTQVSPATVLWYPYVEFRIYADRAFQPLGANYVVQPGTPGSGSWYKRYAASILDVNSVKTLYLPEMTIDATTDSPGPTNQARYMAAFYRPDNSLVQFYACFEQFVVPPTTPTSWTALCAYNSPPAIVPPANEAYTKTQIDARFPVCTTGQMIYYATTGNAQSCLTVGSGLTLSGGTLSTTGTAGTVTSVALSLPGIFSVSGSPVTTTGTLTGSLVTQNNRLVFAGPSGAPYPTGTTGTSATPAFRTMDEYDTYAARSAINVVTNSFCSGAGTQTTTGSITATTTTLTVASSDSWRVGEGVMIPGAGVAGQDLRATVSAISGTTFTIDVTASTTVAGVTIYHDDTTCLEAAILAASAAGRTTTSQLAGKIVYLPAGTYNIFGTLTVPGGVTLEGDGRRKTIIYSTYNGPILDLTASSSLYGEVRNLGVKGVTTAGTSQIGIKVDDAVYGFNALVENIWIEDTGGAGLYIGNVFSSRFENIYSTNAVGGNYIIDAANMPVLTLTHCDSGVVNDSYRTGYHIKAGSIIIRDSNSIFGGNNPEWAVTVGRQIGYFGETAQNTTAFVRFEGCNFESSTLGGVQFLYNSRGAFHASSFVGAGGSSGSYKALLYRVAQYNPTETTGDITSGTPTLVVASAATWTIGQGIKVAGAGALGADLTTTVTNVVGTTLTLNTNASTTVTGATVSHTDDIFYSASQSILTLIDDDSGFSQGPASYYANSEPVHVTCYPSTAACVPPLSVNGRGPRIAGSTFVTKFHNDSTGVARPLGRADAYLPVQTVTTNTTFAVPGVRYIEANCAAACTITLPWPGWFGDRQEAIIIKDISGAAATNNITILAAGGATVNSTGSYVINVNNGAVTLVPESVTTDYRVISTYGSSGSSLPVADTQTIVKGSSDATKLIRFEVDGLTTATTRVLTPPDADIIIAGSAAALTSGRVPYVTTGGLLTDSARLLWDNSTYKLSLSNASTLGLLLQAGGGTTAAHAGTGYGLIMPYVGGSQSSGPGIWWTDGTYASLFGMWLNLGLNIQGTGGVNNVKIRKATDTSSDGDIVFDLRPNDGRFDLYPYGTSPGNTTQIAFRELAANGTNYVAFKAPNSIAADITWTLPSTDSSGTQCLASNGSGTLSWTACSGGGTPGGSNKQVQFNNSSAFGGAAGFEYQSGASPNVSITAQNAAYVPLYVNGASSQSANLQQWAVNSTVYNVITKDGYLYLGRGETSATPASGRIYATGGSGTNIAGASLLIYAGAGTGTGAGGSIAFYTAAASTSSSTPNTPVVQYEIDQKGNHFFGNAQLIQAATDGFVHIPGIANVPNGTPTLITGLVPLAVDETNYRLYGYSGGSWRNLSGGSAGITIGTTTITSGTASRILYETSGNVVGEIAGSSADANGAVQFASTARSSGVAQYFRVNTPADTGMTASTQSVGIYFGGDGAGSTVTRQWATGALTTQREYVFVAPTYAFVGASTLTNAYTLFAAQPIPGSNATFTTRAAIVASTTMSPSSPGVGSQVGPLLTIGTTGGVAYYGYEPTGSNMLRIALERSGNDVAYFGINKNSSTGGVPANAIMIHSFNNIAGFAYAQGSSGNPGDVYFYISSAGLAGFGTNHTTLSAQLHVVSASASRVGLRVDSAATPSADIVQFTNNASNRWALNSSTTATTATVSDVSGGTQVRGTVTENVTLSTGGTTTDSTIDLPANSIILSVTGRITTTITTATDWKLGDATVADRFSDANATLTAGTTTVGINQWKADRTTAGQGAFQQSTAKVRITTTGTPGAGAIRITVHYISMSPPTS